MSLKCLFLGGHHRSIMLKESYQYSNYSVSGTLLLLLDWKIINSYNMFSLNVVRVSPSKWFLRLKKERTYHYDILFVILPFEFLFCMILLFVLYCKFTLLYMFECMCVFLQERVKERERLKHVQHVQHNYIYLVDDGGWWVYNSAHIKLNFFIF